MTIENDSSSNEKAKRLLYVRKDLAGLSREELSEKSDIAVNTIRNWEQALHSGLTPKGAKLLANLYLSMGISITVDWLLYGIGQKPQISSFTKLTYTKSIDSLHEEEIIHKEIEVFKTFNKNAITYIIPDDSMIPIYWPGDYVGGKQYSGEQIKKFIGLPCIVSTDCGITLVRILEQGNDMDLYNLVCSNPNSFMKRVIENTKLKSVAPVLWLRRKEYNR